jgi:hypothetical protein
MHKHFDLSIDELRIDTQALIRMTAEERDELLDELGPALPILTAVAATLRKYREAGRDRLWEPAPTMLESAKAALRIPPNVNKGPYLIAAITNLLVAADVYANLSRFEPPLLQERRSRRTKNAIAIPIQ